MRRFCGVTIVECVEFDMANAWNVLRKSSRRFCQQFQIIKAAETTAALGIQIN
jgi:hypothetical protein